MTITLKDIVIDVIELIEEINLLNDQLYRNVQPGSSDWIVHQSIEEKIIKVLDKLGD